MTGENRRDHVMAMGTLKAGDIIVIICHLSSSAARPRCIRLRLRGHRAASRMHAARGADATAAALTNGSVVHRREVAEKSRELLIYQLPIFHDRK